MRHQRLATWAIGGLLLATTAATAHHDIGVQYNPRQTITLTGTLTDVKWANPHVLVHLDRNPSPSNSAMDWQVELASPNLLMLGGLKIKDLRPGDHVTINAYPARDGSNTAYGTKLTRSTH